MKTVSAARLRRAHERVVNARPYADQLRKILGNLTSRLENVSHPLLAIRPELRILIVVVTADRGLCGAYNSNVMKALERWLAERDENQVEFFVFGRKGYQYLQKRGLKVGRLIADPPLEKVDYRAAKLMARAILPKEDEKPRFDEVWLLYTAFESVARFVPTWTRIAPIELAGSGAVGDVILQPSLEELVERLIPRYIEARLYNALLEAVASEYAMRRISMKNATDAATEMQGILKKQYNRKRQESITKELLDIVGGSEAVR